MRHVQTATIGVDSSIKLLLESVGNKKRWIEAFHFITHQLQCPYGSFVVRAKGDKHILVEEHFGSTPYSVLQSQWSEYLKVNSLKQVISDFCYESSSNNNRQDDGPVKKTVINICGNDQYELTLELNHLMNASFCRKRFEEELSILKPLIICAAKNHYQIQEKLAVMNNKPNLLDANGKAWLIVDKKGFILSSSESARKLTQNENIFDHRTPKYLRFFDEDIQNQFISLLEQSLISKDPSDSRSVSNRHFSNPSAQTNQKVLSLNNHSPLIITVKPLNYDVSYLGVVNQTRAIEVNLRQPLKISPKLRDALMGHYGFSHDEAIIAIRICHGASAEDIAQERSRSVNTVRTQIRSILRKTGTGKQVKLISEVYSHYYKLLQL